MRRWDAMNTTFVVSTYQSSAEYDPRISAIHSPSTEEC